MLHKKCRTVSGLLDAIKDHIPATLKVYCSAANMEGEWKGAWGHNDMTVTLNHGEGRYSQVSIDTFRRIQPYLLIMPC